MQMPESQAAALGVDVNSPMVAGAQAEQAMPEGGPAAQEVSPEILAALGGGQ